MLFFQAALLGGYLYAHATSTWLTVRAQAILHLGVLAAAALALPVALTGAVPPVDRSPIPWLLVLMAGTVGPPFLVLSGTGPILQRWFARSGHPYAANPYPLYAASNLGSALALLAYPFVLEPRLRLVEQGTAWAVGYGALGVLVAGCAWLAWRAPGATAEPVGRALPHDSEVAPAPSVRERAIWVGLAFVPSSLFLGVTTFITTDLSPVPLLWVLPLAIYLLSFTLVFARRPPISHEWMAALHPSAVALAVLLLATGYVERPTWAVPLHLVSLFVIAMTAHGELARRRPHPRHLTAFYLWLSVGGVLGGAFNALLAPVLFDHVWEYPVALVLACLARPWPAEGLGARAHLLVGVRAVGFAVALLYLAGMRGMHPALFLVMGVALVNLLSIFLGRYPGYLALCIGATLFYRSFSVSNEPGLLLAERTFFGRYRVVEAGSIHVLRHGSTLHGAQDLHPDRRGEPMTYYLRRGPLGRIFEVTDGIEGRRVAAVGLGTGTMAAFAHPGEDWTFYEIDPGIVEIARDTTYFTYLHDARAPMRIVLGDARVSLARTDRQYDLIVLDAFSSDAIPTHLMTLEALDTYLARLAPGGLLAFHVSNRHLNLEPVLAALARERGLVGRSGHGPEGDRRVYESISHWIVLAREEAHLGSIAGDRAWWRIRESESVPAWTDDHSSILRVFYW